MIGGAGSGILGLIGLLIPKRNDLISFKIIHILYLNPRFNFFCRRLLNYIKILCSLKNNSLS
jgi:hypothetical protein